MLECLGWLASRASADDRLSGLDLTPANIWEMVLELGFCSRAGCPDRRSAASLAVINELRTFLRLLVVQAVSLSFVAPSETRFLVAVWK